MKKTDNKDEWSILEGRHKGQVLIVRLNTGARKLVGVKQFTFRVGIAVPFKFHVDNLGLPNEVESRALHEIEEEIFAYCNTGQTGILCVIITTGGMREFVSYLEADNIDVLIANLSKKFPEYDFQYYIQPDKGWDGYKVWDSDE